MRELTLQEKATNAATLAHITRVRDLLNDFVMSILQVASVPDSCRAMQPAHSSRIRISRMNHLIGLLLWRGTVHDLSKLELPEVELFAEWTPKLKASTYGSPEYNAMLKELAPALDHHYSHNSHHPEHYPDGIDGMSLVDVIEMYCDWKAASERHEDGSIHKSIEINAGRFKMCSELVAVFKMTAFRFEDEPPGPMRNLSMPLGVYPNITLADLAVSYCVDLTPTASATAAEVAYTPHRQMQRIVANTINCTR